MSIGKVAVLAVALVLVSGGLGAALADWNNTSEPVEPIELVDVDARKAEDDADGALVTEEEGDGDDTAGDDGTAGGDAPAAPQPEPQQQAAGDGDETAGDDGTAQATTPRPRPPRSRPPRQAATTRSTRQRRRWRRGGDETAAVGRWRWRRERRRRRRHLSRPNEICQRAGPAAARSPPPARGLHAGSPEFARREPALRRRCRLRARGRGWSFSIRSPRVPKVDTPRSGVLVSHDSPLLMVSNFRGRSLWNGPRPSSNTHASLFGSLRNQTQSALFPPFRPVEVVRMTFRLRGSQGRQMVARHAADVRSFAAGTAFPSGEAEGASRS